MWFRYNQSVSNKRGFDMRGIPYWRLWLQFENYIFNDCGLDLRIPQELTLMLM